MSFNGGRHRGTYTTTEEIFFDLLEGDLVRLSCGPVSMHFTMNAAYDLQYRLAGFLAHLESGEREQLPEEDEGKQFWDNVATLHNPRT
jgi:hypothetical protein